VVDDIESAAAEPPDDDGGLNDAKEKAGERVGWEIGAEAAGVLSAAKDAFDVAEVVFDDGESAFTVAAVVAHHILGEEQARQRDVLADEMGVLDDDVVEAFEGVVGACGGLGYKPAQVPPDRVEDSVNDFVFVMEMSIESGGDEPDALGDACDAESGESVLGDNAEGCLEDLLLSDSGLCFRCSHWGVPRQCEYMFTYSSGDLLSIDSE